MATYKIHDRTDEFRVDIIGRFAGGCVEEVRTAWQDALKKTLSRQVTVDLTRVSGYDLEGRTLLKDMHQHGTQFGARTPESLVLLQEISTPMRRRPLMIQDLLITDGAPSRKEVDNKAPSKPLPKANSR